MKKKFFTKLFQSILDKYCKFLPVEIEFDGKVVNNPNPIWTKSPSDLKDEDYLNFYKELYPFSEDPLFWIHLNVDYPFNLTGILYFPKVKTDFEVQKNKIQLYSRQVFITDEVKDVVPEFLMLLHGILDSPDIPLNVSRSFLQADSNVKKINAHITKKVADKLSELFKKERAGFEQKWDSIGIFVKYGMISDEKFYDKAKDFALLKSLEDKFYTIEEYKEFIKTNQTDKSGDLIALYTTDPGKQDSYVASAKRRGYDILRFEGILDNHFIGFLERKLDKFHLKRVDSEIIDKLVDKGEAPASVLSEDEKNAIKEVFNKALNDDKLNLSIESLAVDELPVSITLPEFMRRMKDMSMGGGMAMMGNFPLMHNVVVNANHPLTSKILKLESEEEKTRLAKQAYDIALLSQNMLSGNDLTQFIFRSVDLVAK